MAERIKVSPAVYLILEVDGKVPLIRRANTGYEDGNYMLISGHAEPEEPFTQSMAREASEEAGITLNPKKLEFVHMMHRRKPRGDERIDIFFKATSYEGELINNEPEKCDDLSWFPLDDLPDNTVPYIRSALEHYRNGVVYSEFDWEEI